MERAMRELSKALEMSLYYGEQQERYKLRSLLSKLGIKSAHNRYVNTTGGSLTMESLEGLLSKVAYRGLKP